MKVGDLVTYSFASDGQIGLVVETVVPGYTNPHVKVLWQGDAKSSNTCVKHLTLVELVK